MPHPPVFVFFPLPPPFLFPLYLPGPVCAWFSLYNTGKCYISTNMEPRQECVGSPQSMTARSYLSGTECATEHRQNLWMGAATKGWSRTVLWGGRVFFSLLSLSLSNTRLELAASPALHGLCRRWVWLCSSTTRNCRKQMYLHAFISVVMLHSIFPVPSAPSPPSSARLAYFLF